MLDKRSLGLENVHDVFHFELDSRHFQSRSFLGRCFNERVEEPNMLWMRKLTLGVMVSGNVADDD